MRRLAGRKRLAKAELYMLLAVSTLRWRRELMGEDPESLPPEQWPAEDPLAKLCRTHQLTPVQLAQVCDTMGEELERRALRGGYHHAS